MKTLKNAQKQALKFERFSVEMLNIGFINKHIINLGIGELLSITQVPSITCLKIFFLSPLSIYFSL